MVPIVKISNSGKGIVHHRKELWVEDGNLGSEWRTAGLFEMITLSLRLTEHYPTMSS